MCGLYCNFGVGVFENPDANMLSLLERRGPEHTGYYEDEMCKLVHTRLSIIDLSQLANQPMSSEDGKLVTIFNGEIYNYVQLKRNLEEQSSVEFTTTSDTEVILKGYQCFGPKFLENLEGIFALIIYDQSTKSLVVCRDRFGVKPLYTWHITENLIGFCSVPPYRSIIGANENSIDWQSISDFIDRRLICHSEHTFVEGVSNIPPGEIIEYRVNANSVKQKTLYKFSYYKRYEPIIDAPLSVNGHKLSDEERLIYSEVVKSSVSDVPFATLLSGGVDSSLVSLILNHAGFDFESFHLKPTIETPESINARRIAQISGIKLNLIEEEEVNIDLLIDHVRAHSLPASDMSMVNHFFLMAKIKEYGYKVIMSGSGGDEFFAGYPQHKIPLLKYNACMKIGDYFSTGNIKSIINRKTKEYLKYLERSYSGKQNPYIRFPKYDKRRSISGNSENIPLFNALLEDIEVFTLPGFLSYEDANSMYHSIEVRPCLVSSSILAHILSSRSQTTKDTIFKAGPKGILLSLGSKLLGADLIVDRAKYPFPGSIPLFLEKEKDFFMKLINKSGSHFEYIDKNKLIEDLEGVTNNDFKKEKSFDVNILWRSLNLLIWIDQIYVDAKYA